LAGSQAFIDRARKNRKLLGGGMRQAGVIAAPALIALTQMPARLKEDHDNAKYMAEKLAVIPGVSCDPSQVEINMAFFSIDKPAAVRDNLQAAMREKGIKISPEDQGKFRDQQRRIPPGYRPGYGRVGGVLAIAHETHLDLPRLRPTAGRRARPGPLPGRALL
jgi:threonine aldolase